MNLPVVGVTGFMDRETVRQLLGASMRLEEFVRGRVMEWKAVG
jgi:hypothetical protein